MPTASAKNKDITSIKTTTKLFLIVLVIFFAPLKKFTFSKAYAAGISRTHPSNLAKIMFFFALRRFISRTRKTAPTKGRTHRQTKPRLLFVIYILSHLIFIVNCFSPQKKIIFGRLCSSSHIIVAYYSRIISRSGKTYAIFSPGAPIFARFTRK